LEDALRDLGVAVRRQKAVWPGVEAELQALEQMERVHANIVRATDQLDDQGRQAEAHFAEAEADCMERVEKHRARIDQTQRELDLRLKEQADLRAQQTRQERKIRALGKERDDRRAQAGRARQSSEREAQQRLAAEKAIEIGDWLNRKEHTAGQLKDLLEPIEDLRRTLQESRAAVAQAQRDASMAKQELAGTHRQIEEDRRRHQKELQRVEQEIARQLVELGRAAQRHPDGPDGTSAYLDEFLKRIAARREVIADLGTRGQKLQAECEDYDRSGFTKGVVMLAASFAVVVALTVTLIAVLG
jgi:chromosome segregation ATPase